MRTFIKYGIIFATIFILMSSFALWLSWPQRGANGEIIQSISSVNDNPNDPQNAVSLVVFMLSMTAALLLALKFGFGKYFKYAMALSILISLAFVLEYTGFKIFWWLGNSTAVSFISSLWMLNAFVIAVILTVVAMKYTNHPINNFTGFLVAAGGAVIFGVSLGMYPIILLLIILAIYDAVAVYGTKHMIALAKGAIREKIPLLMFVIGKPAGEVVDLDKPRSERGAAVIGLGDFIIPGMFVVSANVFSRTYVINDWSVTSIGALIGGIAGYFLLSRIAEGGDKAHAGLPPINGCVLAGAGIAYLLAMIDQMYILLVVTILWVLMFEIMKKLSNRTLPP